MGKEKSPCAVCSACQCRVIVYVLVGVIIGGLLYFATDKLVQSQLMQTAIFKYSPTTTLKSSTTLKSGLTSIEDPSNY